MTSNLSRREYLRTIRSRYQSGPKGVKSMILGEFCRVCGYSRKYAIRLLNTSPPQDSHYRKHRAGRKPIYNEPKVLDFLERLWIASNLACSKLLKAMITLSDTTPRTSQTTARSCCCRSPLQPLVA